MTDEELFDILRPIILLVTGVPECILADPNAPAPNGSYAAVRPQQSITERGQANVIRIGNNDATQTTKVRAQIAATCWVNFYRDGAMSFAQKLKQCNKRPNVSITLLKNKLGWAGTDAINNLTALQSENFEERAQIAIRLWYETTDEDVINSIERANIGVEYENGTLVTTVDVETPDAPPIP